MIKTRKQVPEGFGLNEHYKSIEKFSTGHCRKRLAVSLDFELWYPCILLWCQSLNLLKRFSLIVQSQTL
jgi:hypothetical protein